MIGVEYRGNGEPNRIGVPLKVNFRDDWTARPQRVILSRTSDGTLTGTFSISAPADDWQHVALNAPASGIEVVESSSQSQGDVETRNFRVVSAPSVTGGQMVALVRGDQTRPFLTVPVLVPR